MTHVVMYIGSLFICLFITSILFVFNIRYYKLYLNNPLNYIYLFLTISILTSTLWAFTNGNPNYKNLTLLSKIIEYCCHTGIIYCWFIYCVENIKTKFWGTKKGKFIASLPLILITIIILSTPWTHIVFYVNENGEYIRGKLYAIHLLGYIFLFGCSIAALAGLRQCVIKKERSKLITIALFSIPPMILGTINLILPPGQIPILHFAVCTSLMIVLLNDQQRSVTLDDLTGLVNRNSFEQHLNNKIIHHKEDSNNSFYVILGDLDNFKNINDQYGHLEGDNALCLVAQILYSVAKQYSAIVAHISGDEFYIIMDKCGEEGPTNYIEQVNSEFEKINQNVKYNLNISFGVAKYTEGMTLKEMINLADSKMYQIKQQHKKR